MNCFIPQDPVSRVEVKDLMGVARHMVTPQNSQVVASLKQDSLLGMYLLTLPGVSLSRGVAYQLVMAIKYPQKELVCSGGFGSGGGFGDSGGFSGADVFSAMLPVTMNFQHGGTRIIQGCLVATDGLVKGVVKVLVHYFWQTNPEAAVHFVSDMQRLANAFLRVRGMSVGITDCLPPPLAKGRVEAMNAELQDLYSRVQTEGNQVGIPRSDLEPVLSTVLSSALNYAGQVCQDKLAITASAAATNNILAMVTSGSKGSMLNIGQIMGVVGQQYVSGSRIKGRLPCFAPGDESKEAHGYVGRSYLQGLRPAEYFHHAMGGREGLVDTAVKSVTGDTPIIIQEGQELKRVLIGDWIDGLLAARNTEVEHYEARNLELLAIDGVTIPTTDERGRVTWGDITAVTRHDPGDQLWEIVTESGRRVIVTESKSLIVYDSETRTLVETPTPDVRIGDRLPVTLELRQCDLLFTVDPSIRMVVHDEHVEFQGSQRDLDWLVLLAATKSSYTAYTNENTILMATAPLQEWEVLNDVILDPIIAKNPVDVARYPKVYDLTVPSTLNFGLANGLHVRDTAEVGYMHRELMKGMESARVAYDGTVRNSMQEVVQFTYGGDGFDAAHLVKTTLPLIKLGDSAILAAAGSPEEATQLMTLRDALRGAQPLSPWRREYSDVVYMPFHAPWLMDQVAAGQRDDRGVYEEGQRDDRGVYEEGQRDDRGVYEEGQRDDRGVHEEAESDGAEGVREASWALAWRHRLMAQLPSPTPCLAAYIAWHCRSTVLSGLTHKAAKRLASAIVRAVNRAAVAPAEMVGALAAQSCGEPTTQLTLNSFHTSGVLHNITQGVPRLKELLNVTAKSKPKTPLMTLSLVRPFCYDREYAASLAHTLPVTPLHALVLSSSGIKEVPLDALDHGHARIFHDFAVAVQRKTLLAHALEFALDMDAMAAYDLSPAALAVRASDGVRACAPELRVHVIASHYSDPAWVLRIRFSRPKGKRSAAKDEAAVLQEVKARILALEVAGIHGVSGAQVTEATVAEPDGDNGCTSAKVYQIVTRGINILAALDIPTVDSGALTCNSVVDVKDLYGLEAAAKALFHEIHAVLCAEGTTLHDRHIMMIVDTMTQGGGLMPMNRHGLNKRHTGPLVRSSFEQTVDVFNEAAVFGERDTMAGVSENVMAGQLAPLGTGYMQVLNSGEAAGGSSGAAAAVSGAASGGVGEPDSDDDVVFSTLADQVDPGAVQYTPCMPRVLPDIDAVVPSFPCDDFQVDSWMNGNKVTGEPPGHYCEKLGHSVEKQGHYRGPFVYRPRSPVAERPASHFVYIPRSP